MSKGDAVVAGSIARSSCSGDVAESQCFSSRHRCQQRLFGKVTTTTTVTGGCCWIKESATH